MGLSVGFLAKYLGFRVSSGVYLVRYTCDMSWSTKNEFGGYAYLSMENCIFSL
jgi:hypothetical protein